MDLASQLYDAMNLEERTQPLLRHLADAALAHQTSLPGYDPVWRPKLERMVQEFLPLLPQWLRRDVVGGWAHNLTQDQLRALVTKAQRIRLDGRPDPIPPEVRSELEALDLRFNRVVHMNFCIRTGYCDWNS